eukprot:CAMPEP_0182860884 /NCGR_PEP_ID=MMETSP0034_2-20130328/5186_1 /TAXON_ID=156128 /ORGANISM="Nephroselmis pyriformis, Strain CCMP717" /LENGTH=648 /DNA_ID=CAMNT_0024992755 /DNA_START=113 /DNA_END=2056 /DNA_ORIENTATION=-
MAFWRVAGLAQTSPVEQILDKEDFSLEDLLDEDDVIQECRSLNARLISFLREKPQIEKLLKYLVEPQQPDEGDAEAGSAATRYSFVSCEILCCEIDAIFTTLLEDEELMELLFSFLDKEDAKSCLRAGYFSRVVSCLLTRRTPDFTRYLQDRPPLLTKLVDEAESTSIAEILMRLVGADEQIMMFHSFALQWLESSPLLQQLCDKLSPEFPAGMHNNVSDILQAVARTIPSGLATKLSSPEYVGAMLKHAFGEGCGSILVAALSVITVVLDPKRGIMGGYAGLIDPSELSHMGLGGGEEEASPEVIACVLSKVGPLVALLGSAPGGHDTTYGRLEPPLGATRLKAVQLIAMALQVGGEPAVEAIIAAGGLRACMGLFLQYPFNNLLHHEVEGMVMHALEGPSEPLLAHLFAGAEGGGCDLVGWLAGAPVMLEAGGAAGPCTPSKSIRAGYVGHVDRMGRRLVECVGRGDAAGVMVSKDGSWGEWSEGALAERLETEDVLKWTCGRPSTTDQPEASSDGEEEADDDFRNDFDMASMATSLNQDVYHRYGMFQTDDGDGDGEFEGEEIMQEEALEVGVDADAIGLGGLMGARLPGGDSSSDEDSDEDTSGVLVAPLGAGAGHGGDDEDEVLVTTSDDEDDEGVMGGGSKV